jgi:hypothetical protein
MSDTSSLSQLARFVGQSALSSADPQASRRAADAIAARLQPRTQKRRVTDLLAAVMALSARTRRLALPHVNIDLDVFSPDGARAARIRLPPR